MQTNKIKEAHVKTECNYRKEIKLRAGQDAPPTVFVARFLNMSHKGLGEVLLFGDAPPHSDTISSTSTR